MTLVRDVIREGFERGPITSESDHLPGSSEPGIGHNTDFHSTYSRACDFGQPLQPPLTVGLATSLPVQRSPKTRCFRSDSLRALLDMVPLVLTCRSEGLRSRIIEPSRRSSGHPDGGTCCDDHLAPLCPKTLRQLHAGVAVTEAAEPMNEYHLPQRTEAPPQGPERSSEDASSATSTVWSTSGAIGVERE